MTQSLALTYHAYMPGSFSFLKKRSTDAFLPKTWFTPIVIYSLIVFLACFGDAIMSYVAPVIIEEHVSNTLMMGIVIAFSSCVGFFCDLLFSQWFRGKKYSFFMILTFLFAILFPASFLFAPPIVATFLFAMAAWGVYFEFMQFSHFHFIHTFVSKDQHAQSWGFLESIIALAYLIGPIVATQLIDLHVDAPHYGALAFFSSGMFGLFLFMRTHRKQHQTTQLQPTTEKRSRFHEIVIWKTLGKRIWPIYLFLFSMILVDSSFWTVGTLASEELRQTHAMGGYLIPISALPAIFMMFVVGKVAQPFGKKRAAFLSGLCSGGILLALILSNNIWFIMGTVLLSSIFQSIARPEIYATLEDYIARLGKNGNDLIGLQNSAASAAYIIGPILSGFLADQFGNLQALGIIGGMFALTSLIALIIVPRKVTMPQAELAALDSK